MNETERERITQRPIGALAARMHGATAILARRAASARDAARELPKDAHEAAMLRGKAKGLDEAITMLARLDRGRPLRGRWRRIQDRKPALPPLQTRCERHCPECESTNLHHCIWDGLSCLDCGWEANPL